MLDPLDVQWHLVAHDCAFKVENNWIHVLPTDVPPDVFDVCYYKMNEGLQRADIAYDDWFSFMCDDDALPLDFYDKLDLEHVPDAIDVVVSSSHYYFHGKHIALIAKPYNCVTGKISIPQLFFRGRLKPFIYYREDHHFADGLMAESVVKRFNLEYRPEAYVEWNKLNPNFWKPGEVK